MREIPEGYHTVTPWIIVRDTARFTVGRTHPPSSGCTWRPATPCTGGRWRPAVPRVTELTELFFGERVGRVRDPWGNVWWIQTRVEEVAPEELARRARDEKYLDAMRYVQASLDRELSGR